MEEEDENMYVLVVANDEEKNIKEVLTENLDTTEVDEIMESAQKHVQTLEVDVDMKVEPEDTCEEYESEYIDDDFLDKCDSLDIKEEPSSEDDDYLDDEEFSNEELPYGLSDKHDLKNQYEGHSLEDRKYLIQRKRLATSNKGPKKYLKRIPKSLVEELRQEYKELRHNETKLVSAVEQMMRDNRPPSPPRDYFIMNGIMFECVECGNIAGTLPAANRHYNEKHGPRYLLCYACGDDFRSSINLYKHEKRCRAADAHVVLKARAAVVGSKGRGRPFLSHARDKPFRLRPGPGAAAANHATVKSNMYACSLCSAMFTTKSNLQSHENMHRGERPYRCRGCPRAYTNHSALTRHTRTAHTDDQYICDHCNRSFKCKQGLKYHLYTHEPTRKHGCPECDRRFAQRSALKLHINAVHKNLPPPCACEVCPKRFPRMSLLKDHMQKAHGLKIITREMFYKMLPLMTDSQLKPMQRINSEV